MSCEKDTRDKKKVDVLYLDKPRARKVPDVARQRGVLVPVGLRRQDHGTLGPSPEISEGPKEPHVLLEHHIHFLKTAAKDRDICVSMVLGLFPGARNMFCV